MKKIFFISLFTYLAVTISYAQNVAINADASLPNSSAMLDVKSTSKGMLIPRVALTGTADVTTVPSPATSLMVYNTTAAGTGTTAVVPGYYYWNGSAWVRMVASTAATNTVYKTLIPFASGTQITLTTTAPGPTRQASLVSFGTSGTTTIFNGNIDLTSGPNYAFVVPSSGTITKIAGSFSSASPVTTGTPIFITCQLYFSPPFSNTFTQISGTFVTLGAFNGSNPAGFTGAGSLSGLNISVEGGTRILMVVSADNSFGMNSTIPVYFSGGVNMVIQ